MRKVIAAFNMTLDGIGDHTIGVADEELHQHYSELINDSGVILYGRKTYQLMQFWQGVLKNPADEKSMNDFAVSIDKIPKLVFSQTLKTTNWESAVLSNKPLSEKVVELKEQPGQDILVGSRSLIIQLLNSGLIDEFQICIHPIIQGKGLPMFENIKQQILFKLNKTKIFSSGAIVHYYEPKKEAKNE